MATFVSTGSNAELARLALEHRLFDTDGTLSHTLDLIARGDNPDSYHLALATVAGVGVGIAVADHSLLAVYVQPKHRGQKIGSKLIEIVKAKVGSAPQVFSAHLGANVEASRRFWHKNYVVIQEDTHALTEAQVQSIVELVNDPDKQAEFVDRLIEENRAREWAALISP